MNDIPRQLLSSNPQIARVQAALIRRGLPGHRGNGYFGSFIIEQILNTGLSREELLANEDVRKWLHL